MIAGPLAQPSISGEILTHEFVVETPFDWPTSDTENGFWEPELDLIFHPGENVFFP